MFFKDNKKEVAKLLETELLEEELLQVEDDLFTIPLEGNCEEIKRLSLLKESILKKLGRRRPLW